jgi:hypothetical protein
MFNFARSCNIYCNSQNVLWINCYSMNFYTRATERPSTRTTSRLQEVMDYLKHEQECFIRYKTYISDKAWTVLYLIKHGLRNF